MLSVYTRHYPPCRETDPHYRRCRCPKWINGTLPSGTFIRASAKTRSWEAAEKKSRSLETEAPAGLSVPSPLSAPIAVKEQERLEDAAATRRILHSIDIPQGIKIKDAVKQLLLDEQARRLAKTSTSQSKTLFEKQLLMWAHKEKLTWLDELTTAKLREFRASWNNGPLTTQRKHHRLNGFFQFCIENDWLQKNPSKKMKSVQVSQRPTDYFTPIEAQKIGSRANRNLVRCFKRCAPPAKERICIPPNALF